MTLTYTEKRWPTVETVERTVEAPKSWGMYTPAGNRSIQKRAERLLKEAEAAKGFMELAKAFDKFFKSYSSMKGKSVSESGDTEVRECVWFFAEKVGKAVNFSEGALENLWEERYLK